MSAEVRVLDDASALAEQAAAAIRAAAREALARRGAFGWAAAGGGTPRDAYERATRPRAGRAFPFSSTDTFLGDERIVPRDDPASNYAMVRASFYRHAAGHEEGLHGFDPELDPQQAADAYAAVLERRLPAGPGGLPRLDLVVLGLGPDAHTASWFPGTRFADDRSVVVTARAHAGHRRWTLTPAVVNAARSILFLVCGAGKREALEAVHHGPRDPRRIPAQRVDPLDGRVLWLVDRAAAGHSAWG